MTEIRPFTINVPQAAIDDLHARIRAARWPDKEQVDNWDQGIPLAVVQDFATYWAKQYDWRACEAALNAHPNFLIELDGVDIHFLHIRSKHEGARPLIMTHGWPGSVLEFMAVIEPLTNPADPADAFHLVIPSLPGFGFSGKPTETGWSITKIAKAWNDLMLALGYERYFAQGGDWGSGVTLEIARQNLGACAAVHSNMVLVLPDPATMGDLSDLEKRAAARMQYYQEKESGYSSIQKTRPQTIGYALADSAVGQMAWILEKFRNWSDCDDNFSGFSRDALLDTITLYWLTNSAASSARLYWHSFSQMGFDPISLPTGGTIFPKELFQTSRRWAEKRFSNLIYWNEVDKGGHFAALEVPDIFAREVRACFRNASL
ncbi:epoxide hydrolase family protein [Blastomonas sp.]|uniref:epoxide hydrolase family protein n=1 Tax=Blastomonas sp. TaxID=1909299 RepID=UPI00406A9292